MPDNKYTVEQLGQVAKIKFPKLYGTMDDKAAGMAVISKYPSLQKVASDYQSPQQEGQSNKQPSPQSFTIEQVGKGAKIEFPAVYGDMGDSMAGNEFIKKNPSASQYVKKKDNSVQGGGIPLPVSSQNSTDSSSSEERRVRK